MAKFSVQNLTGKSIKLGIEPVAELEILDPDGKAEFEYEEPAEVAFSIDEDGGATVAIVSARFKVSSNGKQKVFELPDKW
jgi:hypothetical protein